MRLLKGRRAPADFLRWSGPRTTAEFRGQTLRSPLYVNRATSFQSLHTVSVDALRAMLPTDDLHPVQWFDGSGLVMLFAARYADLSGSLADGKPMRVEPYAEAATVALVSREPLRRGLPLLQPAMPHVGGFVLDMPVTHALARDSGRELYGFPKFVADLHFYEEPDRRVVDVWDDGVHVLSLDVRPGGRLRTDRRPLTMYSSRRGELLATTMPFLGWGQRFLGPRGHLLLGEHPMAARLKTLEVSPTSVMGVSYVDARIILPAGMPVGRAREYAGHVGADRERGDFTVRYPESGAIDQYERFTAGVA